MAQILAHSSYIIVPFLNAVYLMNCAPYMILKNSVAIFPNSAGLKISCCYGPGYYQGAVRAGATGAIAPVNFEKAQIKDLLKNALLTV